MRRSLPEQSEQSEQSKQSLRSAQRACPCGQSGPAGRPLTFNTCCGRYIDNFAATPAPDAAALMRSRYTAFVMQRADYLLATWHSSMRPASIKFEPGVKWLGLEVRSQRASLPDAQGEVEFIARQKPLGAPAVRLHERSRFVLEQARWYYVNGDQL